RVTETADALLVAQGLTERLTEHDRRVLDGVVRVDVDVALRFDPQIETAVHAEGVQHVIVERDAGGHLHLSAAVQVEFDPDGRLLGGAFDLADAAHRGTSLLACRKASFSSGVPMDTRRCPAIPMSRINT